MSTTVKLRSLRVKFHLYRLTGGLTLYNLFISKTQRCSWWSSYHPLNFGRQQTVGQLSFSLVTSLVQLFAIRSAGCSLLGRAIWRSQYVNKLCQKLAYIFSPVSVSNRLATTGWSSAVIERNWVRQIVFNFKRYPASTHSRESCFKIYIIMFLFAHWTLA